MKPATAMRQFRGPAVCKGGSSVGKANPVAWSAEKSSSGEKTDPEAGRLRNGGGNTVQEATPDDEDPQPGKCLVTVPCSA